MSLPPLPEAEKNRKIGDRQPFSRRTVAYFQTVAGREKGVWPRFFRFFTASSQRGDGACRGNRPRADAWGYVLCSPVLVQEVRDGHDALVIILHAILLVG